MRINRAEIEKRISTLEQFNAPDRIVLINSAKISRPEWEHNLAHDHDALPKGEWCEYVVSPHISIILTGDDLTL